MLSVEHGRTLIRQNQLLLTGPIKYEICYVCQHDEAIYLITLCL